MRNHRELVGGLAGLTRGPIHRLSVRCGVVLADYRDAVAHNQSVRRQAARIF
jgi:hypothetical protein